MERQKSTSVPKIVPWNVPDETWNGTTMLFNICSHFLRFRLGTVDLDGCIFRHPIQAGTFHFVSLRGYFWNDFTIFLTRV
jgi:hypothetical protein